MLRIAIIIPPVEDFYTTPHRISYLGSRIAVSILEKAGHDVTILNALSDTAKKRQIPLPAPLSYLSPYILKGESGRCSYFTRYHHFGEEYDALALKVIEYQPSLCIITCFAYCYSDAAITIAHAIKRRALTIPVAACGAGVTVHPEHFLRDTSIDYTLSGEAEVNLLPFIEYATSARINPEQVQGLGYKNESLHFFTSSPRPSTSSTLQPVIAQTAETKKSVFYTASISRGCDSACRFCANHLVHGRSFRYASAERIDSLLQKLPHPPASKTVQFNFEDDNLLCDIPYFRTVIHTIRNRFPNVRFTAENGLDYRLMNGSLCEHLIDAGFIQFNFTLGSLSKEILAGEARSGSEEHFDMLLARCNTRGCKVISYIICGFPGDTRETIAESLRFLMNRKTTIGISLFYPVPGIPGFRNPELFDNRSPVLCRGSSAYPWNNSLSTETLVTAFRIARMINCMRSSNVTIQEREAISRTHHNRSLHTIVKVNGDLRVIEVPGQDSTLVKMVF